MSCEERVFYVCSYGGSGSKMLVRYLKQFGKVEHIHSREPPLSLAYVGRKHTRSTAVHFEWFNEVPVPEDKLLDYRVIFIYKDPVSAIYSRFGESHLKHIQCPVLPYPTVADVVREKEDLFGIESFFDNYTCPLVERNYKILCVKYEELFQRFDEFNEALGIQGNCPTKRETIRVRDPVEEEELRLVYQPLLDKIKDMPFLTWR